MRVAKMMTQVPSITLDQIREFTPAERMELGTANGVSTGPIKSEKVKKFLEAHEMTHADKNFVLQHANDSGYSEKAFFHAVSYMNSHGGNQQVSQKEVVFTSVTGEEMKRPNTVIPMPFDMPLKRPLVQRLAVLAGTFTKMSGSKVVPYSNMKEIMKAWKGTVFRAAGIPLFQACVVDIVNQDKAFQIRLQGKSAISEDEFLVFLPQIFNRCPMIDFISLNQIVIYQLFEFFVQRRAQDGRMEYKRKTRLASGLKNGKPVRENVIPEKNLARLEDVFPILTPAQTTEFDKMRKDIGVPRLYFLRDTLDASHTFQEVVGTMDAVVKGFQLGNLLRGSEGVATSRLYEQLGFSGLADDFEKKVTLLLAMTLGAYDQLKTMDTPNPLLDVQMTSVGEGALLFNSLSQLLPNDSWRLILPESGDFPKVHPGIHHRCLSRSRENACYIRFSPLEFQTLPSLGDYRTKCSQDIPRHNPKYYVLYTPVYGPYWWQTAESAKLEQKETSLGGSNSFIPVSPPPRPLQVYRFGSSARLKAIVTDLPAFGLVGMDRGKAKPVSLHRMLTEESWYRTILMSMAEKNSFFMNPYAHFSSLSNLPIASKTSVIFSRVNIVANEDHLSGDVDAFEQESDYDSDDGEWQGVDEVPSTEAPVFVPDQEEQGDDSDSHDSDEDVLDDAPVTTAPRPPEKKPLQVDLSTGTKRAPVVKVDSPSVANLPKYQKKRVRKDKSDDVVLEDGSTLVVEAKKVDLSEVGFNQEY